MDSNNLSISIIIPVHNDPKNIEKCLQAIMKSSYTNYECIVVDDASTDESINIAKKFPIKFVQLSKNQGPAQARNRGVEIASGEILFFIDADVKIYPDTLSKVAQTFNQQPDIDALIGSYDDAPENNTFISQYKNLFHHYVHQNASTKALTFWSGCGAIRREIFLKFGGFNINYGRPAIEDIELGYRLSANDHRIILHKKIQVKHLKRWTLKSLIKTDVFDRALPWTIIMLRDKTFPKDLNLQISQRISVIFVYFMILSIALYVIPFYLPPTFLLLPFLNMIFIIIINYRFYQFFLKKRGLLFTIKVIPLHLLYFTYSGLGFILGVLAHLLGKKI